MKRLPGGHVPPHPTHYERLGVPPDASAAQIDAAWQAVAPTLPPCDPMTPNLVTPGITDSPALRAAAVRLAYAVLCSPARRAVYDAWLASQQPSGGGWWQRVSAVFKRRR